VRVLVYPHSMEIGGSQLNAVELGGAVRDLGHEVLVMSEPGPLVEKVHSLGLEHLPIPLSRRRPSPEVIGSLVAQVRRRGVDVVHGHEWPPALEAYLGPGLRLGVPAVASVMSAVVAPFLPRNVPLVVGTEQLRRDVVAGGYRNVTLIEPPVDVVANSPEVGAGDFRAAHGLAADGLAADGLVADGLAADGLVADGLAADGLLVVVCCRLVPELKLEGLLTACDAFGELVRDGYRVQLAVVGDGPARTEVAERADQANGLAGRVAVVMVGELADPRPAYAAADVVLGMGGSALRGMAFGKPLVVQGERGFWKACYPETAAEFLAGGWYGLGPGTGGVARLKRELAPLLADPRLRATTGRFSRTLVVDRFGLAAAARVLVDVYRTAIESPRPPRTADLARVAGLLPIYKIRRKLARINGLQIADDFNAIRVR
jgi:glycosyltransferase involved in cell wall biosynthesis